MWCMDHLGVGWGRMMAGLFGVVVVPFKANTERRHHIPKQRHRATNSVAYMQPCASAAA